MSILITILFSTFVLLNGLQSFKTDEHGFTTINSTNIDEFIDKYTHVFAFIYVPTEAKTTSTLEALNKAGVLIGNVPDHVILLKVPIAYDDKLVNRFDVENGMGLFAIMDNGLRNVEFSGLSTSSNEILNFFHKKMLPRVNEVNDVATLKKIVENNKCISLGLFKNTTLSGEFEEYKGAADWFYECDHLFSSNQEVIDFIHPNQTLPTVKFFKGCIHDLWELPEFVKMNEEIEILKFLVAAHQPDLGHFTMDWLMKKHLKTPLFTLVLFCTSKDTRLTSYKRILDKYAKRYRNEVNIAYIEVDLDTDADEFMKSTGIKSWNELPKLRAIGQTLLYGNNTRKYKPKGDSNKITDEYVNRFIGDVYYNQLTPYLLSSPLPPASETTDKDRLITTVVGDNFKEITGNPNTKTLLAIYAFSPKFERLFDGPMHQLAEYYKYINLLNTKVIIARGNYTDNEFYGWHPQKFPLLILFPEGGKTAGTFGIQYKNEDFTYENIKIFIDSNGTKDRIKKEETKKSDEKPDSSKSSSDSKISSDSKHSSNENDDEAEVNEESENVKTEL